MTSATLRAQTLGQLIRFVGVGASSTLAYLGLYAALRGVMVALLANLISAVVTTVISTALHRRITFGQRPNGAGMVQQVQGLLLFGLGFAMTSGALSSLTALVSQPARTTELAVLIAATGTGGLLRFALLRSWVFKVA